MLISILYFADQGGFCSLANTYSWLNVYPKNKCFQFVASPPDAACGGAAEAGVMWRIKLPTFFWNFRVNENKGLKVQTTLAK